MFKKSLISLSAALMFATAFQTANAQSTPAAAAPSAAKKELITRLLKLQRPGIEAMSRDMAQEPALLMLERAAAVVQSRVPQDKQEATIKGLQADAKKYLDTTIPMVRDRALALAPDTVGPVLDQKLLIQWREIKTQAGLFNGRDIVQVMLAEPKHRTTQIFTLKCSL